MRVSTISIPSMIMLVMLGCASNGSVDRTVTEVEFGPTGTEARSEIQTVDNEVINSLQEEWVTDTIHVTAVAPVVERYPDRNRNRGLARSAALAQAYAALALEVGSVQVTETITVNDMAASQLVQTRLDETIRGAFIESERLDEAQDQYEVTLGLPKVVLLRVVVETRR